ncbi:hypothetical protein [Haemophilus parainfluenzae]|jgi:hypothetical protein|uniref:hypothetical protein n=1 Tax=Haemophilus parainfluenzae TaxID=729 RepID=UPI00066AA5C2|nr:hypothetical protein [Haemophilus parainfluenzae]
MKKLSFLLFFSLISIETSALIVDTQERGTFRECKDSFGGFISSCDEEKVKIPKIISDGSNIQAIFLGENSGKYINFEVNEIKYNSKKGSCQLIYPNSISQMTIRIGKCRVL